jgi:hypothetical protein
VLSSVLEDCVESGHEIPKPTQGLDDAPYLAPDPKVQAAVQVLAFA